jgi:uncharacterized protein (DUF2225 family)
MYPIEKIVVRCQLCKGIEMGTNDELVFDDVGGNIYQEYICPNCKYVIALRIDLTE